MAVADLLQRKVVARNVLPAFGLAEPALHEGAQLGEQTSLFPAFFAEAV